MLIQHTLSLTVVKSLQFKGWAYLIRDFHQSARLNDTLYKPAVPISRIQWYKLQAKISVLKRRLGDKYSLIGRDHRKSPYSLNPGKFDFARPPKEPELIPEIDLLLAKQGFTCPLPIIPGNLKATLDIVRAVQPFIETEKAKLAQEEANKKDSKGTKLYDASGVEKKEEDFKPYNLPVTSTIDTTTSIKSDLAIANNSKENVYDSESLPQSYLSRALTVESERSIEDKVARAIAKMHLDIFKPDNSNDLESESKSVVPIRDGLSSAPYFLNGITPQDLDVLVNQIPSIEIEFGLNKDVSDTNKIESCEISKRMFSLDNASQAQLNEFNRQRMVLLFGGSLQNCGDTAAQAAIATLSINRMKHHMETRKRDKNIAMALDKFIAKRKRNLKYLRISDLKRYILTCRALGVKPAGTV